MVRIGTSHFVSLSSAAHYYLPCYNGSFAHAFAAASEKLQRGEIHIGKPILASPLGRIVTIDGGDRYAIEYHDGDRP